MSIASEITRLSSAKAALKDAIVAKGVEVADSLKLDGYAKKVAAIPTGGLDITEYDSDDTEMELVCDYAISLTFVVSVHIPNSKVVVSFGDGTFSDEINTAGAQRITHSYGKGKYRVKITCVSNEQNVYSLGNTWSEGVFGGAIYTTPTSVNIISYNTIKTVLAGRKCKDIIIPFGINIETIKFSLGRSQCRLGYSYRVNIGNTNLLKVLMLNGEQSDVDGFMYNQGTTPALEYLSLSGSTVVINSFFNLCIALKEIRIPDTVTTIKSNAFTSLRAMRALYIGSGVVEIANNAFTGWPCCIKLECKAVTPPTLLGENAFGDVLNDDVVIEIPRGTMSLYESASNWNKYVGHFVEKDF